MIGAVIGDIAGSRFEFHNHRSKDFILLSHKCFFTDDTAMTLAVCDALLKTDGSTEGLESEVVRSMQEIGRHYPDSGYGGRFYEWVFSDAPRPYGSYGNGAAMRVSGAAYAGSTEDEVRTLSACVTRVTHNHPEGLKGAEATAIAVFMARTGRTMREIRERITQEYYPLDFTLDELRPTYRFNETCQGTVPQALEAFFESKGFEDAIRNAVSVGGDSDTLAAITGAVAEAYYGVPDELRSAALGFLDKRLLGILRAFEAQYPPKRA